MTMIPHGYKRSEVGIIPENWLVKELGQILTIHHGKSQKEVESDDGKYPIMATGGQIGWSRSYLYNKPSVLIGRKGTIDKPQFIDTPFWTVDTLFYTSIQPDCDPVFTYSACCRINWESYNEGTCVPSLIASTIEKIKLPIPSDLAEQRAIATALSDVDALIEAKTALLEKKRAIKQGAMQELLTGKRRLPGFPVTPMKNTEIGEIPVDWEVKKLGEIGVVKMCKRIFKHETAAEGDIPFFKIGTFGQQPDAYISREKFNTYKALYPYPQKGIPLISAAGTIGRVVVYDGQEAYYQDSNIVWLEHEQKDILNAFLQYYYSVIKWVTETGSAITRLYNNNILSSQVALPTLEEQAAIASVLVDMDSEIESLEEELEKLVDLKQGMMQNLLTGRIRLV